MVTKEEKRWIWQFCIVILFLTTIPYIMGYAIQGESWRFTGFVFGVEDGNSYIAKMLMGAAGAWLFQTPYTAYPQNGFLAFLPYLLLGKMSSPPAQHEQLVVLFQLFRWIGGMAMIWSTYQFLALFFDAVKIRRWGVLIVTLGGGLGWLSVFGLRDHWSSGLPLEFYSPETFGFLSLLGLPHLALGRAFLLWGMIAFIQLLNNNKPSIRQLIMPGCWWFLLGFMQPLTVVTGWLVLAGFAILFCFIYLVKIRRGEDTHEIGWKRVVSLVALQGVLSAPMVVYTFVSFFFDPSLKEWSSQNLILSPPITDYLLAFGSILPLVAFGIPALIGKKNPSLLILWSWVILFPFLAYAPYNLQRRLPDGVWVALVTLGLFGMPILQSRIKRRLANIWVGLGILSSLLFLIGCIFTTMQLSTPIFRPIEEVKVFDFISDNYPRDTVVLAAHDTSNALPAWAPVKTIIGHGPESMKLAELKPSVDRFFENRMKIDDVRNFIRVFNIRLVLLTPKEATFNPIEGEKGEIFKEVFTIGAYKLLEVAK